MTNPDRSFNIQDVKGMLPGIAVSVTAIIVLVLVTDVNKAVDALRMADYRYLPLSLAAFLGTLMTRSLAWRAILQEKITFSKAFFTINEGYLLNNILPFRLGELGRAFLLSRTAGMSFWEVLSTILMERIFDVAIMAGLLLGTLPFVFGAEWAQQAAIVAGLMVLLGMVVLHLLARNQEMVINLFEKISVRWPKIASFGREKIEAFFDGLTALTDARRFGRVLGLMLLTWILNISWYFILLKAFLPHADFFWAATSVGIASLGVSVPSSPAYVGVLEAAMIGALALFQVDASTALAFAITSHALYFVVTVSLGAFGLARDGESLSHVYRQVRKKEN
jgi:uncharacterized protein (TIRG00374 family)